MPFKHTSLLINKEDDRRIKLSDKDKALIVKLYTTTDTSHRKLAAQFGVSKRLIQFIVNPASKEANDLSRAMRGGSKVYYSKNKQKEYMKSHRRYKQQLYLNGDLISK